MGGWLAVEAGANPQTSLVSETLFPTSLRSPGVMNVGSPFLLFPEINTFARPYPCRAGSTPTTAGSCPVHFLDERISPSTSPLFNAQLADASPCSYFLRMYRMPQKSLLYSHIYFYSLLFKSLAQRFTNKILCRQYSRI